MSTNVRKLLEDFDVLIEADKRLAADEILLRLADVDAGDLSEDALVETADELFRALDAEEARHAAR